jgi:hypothetical protein
MSKKVFAVVAGRHSRISTAGKQDWYLSLSWSSENKHTQEVIKSWNSVLWQAIAVFHPKEVGPTLIEFTQKLAYVP